MIKWINKLVNNFNKHIKLSELRNIPCGEWMMTAKDVELYNPYNLKFGAGLSWTPRMALINSCVVVSASQCYSIVYSNLITTWQESKSVISSSRNI